MSDTKSPKHSSHQNPAHDTENTEKIENTVKTEKSTKSKRPIGKIILVIVGVLVLMLLSGYLGYYLRGRSAQTQQEKQTQQIKELEAKVKTLEDANTALQADKAKLEADAAAKATATPVVTGPSAATKANIQDAIKSGNTAALEGYMANPVRVVIAASGGEGDKSPADAVASLTYLDPGTDPWNFAVPAATLAQWRAGSYASYFPVSAVVGRSANNYVVAFGFNSAGKINTVFMAVNSDLLQ